MLDLRDIDAACAEARRCVSELGFVGVFLRPNLVEGKPLFDEKYEPLWATIEELGVPISFHEGSKVLAPQVGPPQLGNRWAMWHVCTHAHEQQIAMVAMVMGGVLERHPHLRCGFLECGCGWLPYWLWRMDEHAEPDRWSYQLAEPAAPLRLRPSEYVLRQCYVSLESDEGPGRWAVESTRGKNIVWASDFPHVDAIFPGAVKTLFELEGIDRSSLALILRDNPLEFYGSALREAVRGPAYR